MACCCHVPCRGIRSIAFRTSGQIDFLLGITFRKANGPNACLQAAFSKISGYKDLQQSLLRSFSEPTPNCIRRRFSLQFHALQLSYSVDTMKHQVLAIMSALFVCALGMPSFFETRQEEDGIIVTEEYLEAAIQASGVTSNGTLPESGPVVQAIPPSRVRPSLVSWSCPGSS